MPGLVRNSVRSRVVLAMLGASLLASAVSAVAEPPDPPGRDGLPALQNERSVAGGGVTVSPLPDDSAVANAPVVRASWPGAGSAELRLPEMAATATESEPARAGELPVWIARSPGKDGAGASVAHQAGRVKVEVMDRKKTEAAGVRGVLVRVSPVDGDTGGLLSVRVNYKGFSTAFGGDYAQRLRLVTFPECVLSTPDRTECAIETLVASTNSATRGEVTGQVDTTAGEPVVLAAVPGPSSGSGDFKATSLSPTGAWSVGGSSGDFTYSYPLRLPPALGGKAPELSLGYSSGSVDGRTSATNNQASWIGDGWDMNAGFIERRYKSCQDDGHTGKGDLCWGTDNATLTLNGKSTELIKDANSGVWRPKRDDGARVEKLTGAPNGARDGEHWKVTAVDGTQYVFGMYRLPGWSSGKTETRSVWTVPVFGNNTGEPCHNDTSFDASSCSQAYRWNLDYVVDPHGNATGYFYEREGNFYARSGNTATPALYIRGGWLAQINYGLRADDLYAPPPVSVRFDMTERCIPSGTITCAASQLNAANASAWPDVPFDQICNQGELCTNRKSPTFFSRKRLVRIVTMISGGAKQVDSWSLAQSFPPVDEFAPSMWLSSVQHTGHVGGTAQLPAITFRPIAKPNRVDSDADHGRPPLIRNRIAQIVTETGGLIGVGYTEPDCRAADRMPANPHTNTLRCFPQWWLPPGAFEQVQEYFHKYVAIQVTEEPRTVGGSGQPVLTRYDYLDDAAWHFDENDLAPADKRTWSQWRGYGKVKVTKGAATGDQSVTETRYLRGMDGDKQPSGARDVWVTDAENGRAEDHDPLQGQARETLSYDGATVARATVYDHWVSDPTSVNGEKKAFVSAVSGERARTLLTGTNWRRTHTTTTYNTQGIPTQVEDFGDLAVTGDETCVLTAYARNEGSWLLTYPKSVRTVFGTCGELIGPGERMREVRSSYDGAAWEIPPSKGDVTRVDELDRWERTGQTWVTTARSTYDSYGRVRESVDAHDTKTTTTYTPASGAQVTSVKIAKPRNHSSTTTFEPAWGLPRTSTTASGATTQTEYDPLGRLVRGWKPGHSPADNEKPDVVFEYQVDQNTASVVTTKTLQDNNTYLTAYALFDGLGRPSQTQNPGAGSAGGRVITDTFYDTRGLVYKQFQPYWNDQPPAAAMFAAAADNMVPRRTVTTFDQLERPKVEFLHSYTRTEHWTTYAYEGDRVHMRPPGGGTATTTIKDAQDRVTELRQYHAVTVGGSYDSTRYTYTPQGDLETLTDPAGNVWRHDYDLRGRKISSDDPDRSHTGYTYDELGQLTTTTDARNQTIAYDYDELGRKTGMFADSITGTKLAEWTYDTVKTGLLASSTRIVAGQEYTTKVTAYDDADRPTATDIVIPATERELGTTYTYATAYTLTGKQDELEIPAAGGLPREWVTTTYNAVGLPDTTFGVRGDGAPSKYVSETNYSPYGEPLRLSLAAEDSSANVSIGYQYYEATRRMSQTTSHRETTSGYQSVFDLNYTYDQIGNILQITDLNSDTQCFTYDNLRRLTQAWAPRTHSCTTTPSIAAMGGAAPYWLNWTFDNVGNRRTQVSHTAGGDTTTTHTYPLPGEPRPHAVRTVTTAGPAGNRTEEYGYDATGNTTSRGPPGAADTLDYDHEGRLVEADDPDAGTSTYVYDSEGERLLKREPEATTLYLPGMELRRDASTGEVTATRYYKHNDTTVAVRTPSGLTWTLPDHQGTVAATVSSDATRVSRRYRDPYGNPRGQAASAWPDRRGYLNAPTDTTGLTHLGARQYDPATGRFLTVDPLIDTNDPQQFNAYTYSNGNPTTFSDPDGRCYVGEYENYCDGHEPPRGGSGGGGGGGGGSGGSSGGGGGGSKPKPAPWSDDMEQIKKELAEKYGRSNFDDMVGPIRLGNREALPDHLREMALEDLTNRMCELHPDNCFEIGFEIAAAGVWVAKPGMTPEDKAAAEKVRNAVQQTLSDYSADDFLGELSDGERAHLVRERWSIKMWFGHALHRATAQKLRELYPGDFQYRSNRDVDFIDRRTGGRVELTTVGQIDQHIARGGGYLTSAYVAYNIYAPFGMR